MLRDGYNELEVRRVISPITQTNSSSAIVGQVIDLANIHECTFLIEYGDMTDADATVAALLEESNSSDMSGSNEVADDDLIGTEAAAGAAAASDDNKVAKLGYKGSKRYVRLTLTPTGNNSGALPVAAQAVLRHCRVQPAA